MPDVSDQPANPQHTPAKINLAPEPFAHAISLVTDRVANRLMAALILYAAIRSAFVAAFKPFWYDEVCTILVARLPSVASIWRALQQGSDGMPPPYYLLERVAGQLTANQQLAYRIPSILGFCCVLVCVFVFIRKRSGSVIALICAPVPLITILYTTYAAEARPYSLVVALVAVALVCYQQAPSKPWMILMGLSLALAVAMHYFAIFALAPFFLAELFLVLYARRLRLSVWFALVCSSAPLWALWPLLAKLKETYGTHYWASTSLPEVLRTYGALFNTAATLGFAAVAVSGALAVAAVAALAFGLLVTTLPSFRGLRDDPKVPTLFSEHVLTLGILALPFFVFATMRITHGGMVPRYSLPAVLGIPLAMGFVLPRLDRKTLALVAIFVFLGLADQEAGFWTSARGALLGGETRAMHLKKFIESAEYADLPVVASDAFDYLQIQQYSSPEIKKRLFVMVDPPQAVTYAGTDTVDKQLLALQAFVPLHVYDFNVFISSHPRFLLYSTGDAQFDWWPVRLNRDGYVLQVLNAEKNQKVYLVRAKGD